MTLSDLNPVLCVDPGPSSVFETHTPSGSQSVLELLCLKLLVRSPKSLYETFQDLRIWMSETGGYLLDPSDCLPFDDFPSPLLIQCLYLSFHGSVSSKCSDI